MSKHNLDIRNLAYRLAMEKDISINKAIRMIKKSRRYFENKRKMK